MTKRFFYLTFLLILLTGTLSAKLKYTQEFTLSTFSSQEDTKKNVSQFLSAAVGDPNLMVVGIEYKNEKIGKDCIAYHAILTCLVSEADVDVARVTKKMADRNPDIVTYNVCDVKTK